MQETIFNMLITINNNVITINSIFTTKSANSNLSNRYMTNGIRVKTGNTKKQKIYKNIKTNIFDL